MDLNNFLILALNQFYLNSPFLYLLPVDDQKAFFFHGYRKGLLPKTGE